MKLLNKFFNKNTKVIYNTYTLNGNTLIKIVKEDIIPIKYRGFLKSTCYYEETEWIKQSKYHTNTQDYLIEIDGIYNSKYKIIINK